jgi:Peptidase family S41
MKINSKSIIIAMLLVTTSAMAQTNDWASKTVQDINAAKALIEQNSPVGVDAANPTMQAWHRDGAEQALTRAASVRDENGWRWTLGSYVNGYQDPHLSFRPKNFTTNDRYTSFVIGESGDGAVVIWSDQNVPSAPKVGDKLRSCDGLNLDALKSKHVYPFTLNPLIPVDRRLAAREVFRDRSVFFAPPIKACGFEQEPERPVVWQNARETADPFWTAWSLAGAGPSAIADVGATQPGVFWIGLPSFAPIGPSSDAIDATVAAFQRQGDSLRQGSLIVVDVRGNAGGTSLQGEKLANAIWGEAAIGSNLREANQNDVDWRASQSNADYLRTGSMLLRLRFPKQAYGKHLAETVIPGIRRAVASNQPFFRDGSNRAQAATVGTLTRKRGEKPFPARVIILSNGICASACLDFADIALNMPGTLLLGAPTGADGLLMEVRSMALPSGRGNVSLPIKVVRGRARGNLAVYNPDIAYQGEWSDEKVKLWLYSLLADKKL